MKKILKNLLVAISIISYFMILVLANTRMSIERLANDIKVFAGAFLVVAILVLEKAYKKDSGKTAITSIELLVLAFHSLSIVHMVNIFKCDFHFYLIISSTLVVAYYIIKGIVIYTKDRKEYLKGLSANNTYKDLMSNISTNYNVELKEANGTKITDNSSMLKTGMKLSIGDNNYEIVIKGDMSGDGKMSITDLSQMRYHLAKVSGKTKSGAYKQAGDMNDKDGVTITDLSQMRKKLAGVN